MKKLLFSLICFLGCYGFAFAANLSPQWQEQLIIEAEDIAKLPTNSVILDGRQGIQTNFIPQSVQVDWRKFFIDQEVANHAQIVQLFSELGISGDEPVVVYDNGVKDGSASMIFWLLEYAGHKNIKILNGGFEAFVQNQKTTTKPLLPKMKTTKLVENANVMTEIKEMLTYYGDYDLAIIDPRSDAEFLGWPLSGEKRGGHIRTAINFSPLWAYNENGKLKKEDEIRKIMYQKGITPEKTFISYSNLDPRAAQIYYLLRMMGFSEVSNTRFTFNVWAENNVLPVSQAPNWKSLVSPEWLNELITTGKAPTYNNKAFKVYEISWGGLDKAEAYKKGHIPGSFHLDSDTFEDERHYWDLFEFSELAKNLASQGIDKDTTIILYGNGTNTMTATITFWALYYAGVEDIRVLNGNFERWEKLGLPVETKINEVTPVKSFGRDIPLHPEVAVGTEEAKEILSDPNGRLCSVRSWAEYTGEVVRHSYIKAKGEPKGAYWARAGFGENKSDLTFYFDIDGSYRSYTEVAKMWSDLDILPSNRVAFYCGTGSRASTGWFFSYLMGWPNSGLYDSGWFGWSEGQPISPNPAQKIWQFN